LWWSLFLKMRGEKEEGAAELNQERSVPNFTIDKIVQLILIKRRIFQRISLCVCVCVCVCVCERVCERESFYLLRSSSITSNSSQKWKKNFFISQLWLESIERKFMRSRKKICGTIFFNLKSHKKWCFSEGQVRREIKMGMSRFVNSGTSSWNHSIILNWVSPSFKNLQVLFYGTWWTLLKNII
jgi:hypothetical protein